MEDKIKKRLQELCPDVMRSNNCICGHWIGCHTKAHVISKTDLEREAVDYPCLHCICRFYHAGGSPITLAVVLQAIAKNTPKLTINLHNGRLFIPKKNIGSHLAWDLEHDNYDNQTKETQLFVGSLLGVV